MEIGLREWLIIGGAAVVLLIVFDGWRRMRGARSRLRMDIEKPPADIPVNDDEGHYNPELPNGGARRVVDGDSTLAVASPPIPPEADVAAVVSDTAAPSLAPEPAAEADEGRTEPTFTIDSLTAEEALAEHPSVDSADKDVAPVELPESAPIDAVEPQSDIAELLNDVPAEPVRGPADSVVVEEDIMSSAALFEAIDFSRKQRVSDLELELASEASESHTVDTEAPVTESPRVDSIVEHSEVVVTEVDTADLETESDIDALNISAAEPAEAAVPHRKADPLLRPMDSAIEDVNHSITSETVDPQTLPPIVSDGPVGDDPLMAGVDASVLDGEEIGSLDNFDAEPQLETEVSEVYRDDSERVEPGVDLLAGLSARDDSDTVTHPEPVTDEVAEEPQKDPVQPLVSSSDSDESVTSKAAEQPLFINELAQREFNKGREVEPSFDFDDTELELPGEFAPAQKKPAVVVSLNNARPQITDEMMLAEPVEVASKDEPVVVRSENDAEPVVEEIEQQAELESEVVAASEPATAAADNDRDLKVQGGSLRQQPDPENVLVMTVISQEPHGFNGSALLQLVLACGMRFGEMDIFHRFEDGIDSGAVQFSMANATGNGVFDVNNMDAIHTRAVSFFMSMEEPREVMNAFECMLATAETLARHLNGELVDDNRILMRPQTQEHYRQRVRDFEMRNLRRRSG